MAKSNIRITQEELKLLGTLNMDGSDEGVINLETELGEVNLVEYLKSFDGAEIEIGLKKKIEESIL